MGQQLLPVILAGGRGARLWPLSRGIYPKQFLPLMGETTMLQATIQRAQGMACLPPLVVCQDTHRFMVAEQLRQIDVTPTSIVLEPQGRNTAPAIALAAITAQQQGSDPFLLVLPADHYIDQVAQWQTAVAFATSVAQQDKLITFGICPSQAEVGYGYIKAGIPIAEQDTLQAHTVAQFIEKPNHADAQRYCDDANYFWNSGMFLFKASVYLSHLATHQPQMLAACQQALANSKNDLDFVRVDAETFAECPADSIDYAVMEKTQDAVVIPLDLTWNDLGSWAALYETTEKNEQGNVAIGDVLSRECHDCYLRSEHRLVAAVGLENIVVVESADAVLVADIQQVQQVKQIVNELQQQQRSEHETHLKVYRPWGAYECLDFANRFQVKRITVKPGASLSLQMHHHRAEHWVVVTGTALVQKDDQQIMLSENESIYIPVGTKHRLTNPGKVELEVIEVQSGHYLGEDDIVRFEDHYGREQ
ncbi:MAG: mannose-1-phosphate guanylyltransferase/mannose-6-phosphate isomerase, partial [Legionellales bacterium]|nr:mannose-1-phosphate guanylyltransferase/mannose-6-phosphate isomerase [Legionellales bacterium]